MDERSNTDALRMRAWGRLVGLLRDARSLLLLYAALDMVRTWLRVRDLADRSLAERFTIESPLALMEDSILLLAAAIALKTRARLGVLVSVGCACVMLYRASRKVSGIAIAENLQPWSVSTFKWWWLIGDGLWDFPRVLVALLIVIWALVAVWRHFARRSGLISDVSALPR